MLRSSAKRSFRVPPDECDFRHRPGRWMSAVTRGRNADVGQLIMEGVEVDGAEETAAAALGAAGVTPHPVSPTGVVATRSSPPLGGLPPTRSMPPQRSPAERMIDDTDALLQLLSKGAAGKRAGAAALDALCDSDGGGSDPDRRGQPRPNMTRPHRYDMKPTEQRYQGFSAHALAEIERYKAHPKELKALQARVRWIQGERAYAHDIMRRNIETQGRLTPAARGDMAAARHAKRAQQTAKLKQRRRRWARQVMLRRESLAAAPVPEGTGWVASAPSRAQTHRATPCSEYIAEAFEELRRHRWQGGSGDPSPTSACASPRASGARSPVPRGRGGTLRLPQPPGDAAASPSEGVQPGSNHNTSGGGGGGGVVAVRGGGALRAHRPSGPRPPVGFWSSAPRYSPAAEERRKALRQSFKSMRAHTARPQSAGASRRDPPTPGARVPRPPSAPPPPGR